MSKCKWAANEKVQKAKELCFLKVHFTFTLRNSNHGFQNTFSAFNDYTAKNQNLLQNRRSYLR